jgi:hypothetical protein
VISEVFIAEEVNGVGDKRSGDTTTVDVRTKTHGGLYEYNPEICMFHWCNFSLIKAKLRVFGLPSRNARSSEFPNYQTSYYINFVVITYSRVISP